MCILPPIFYAQKNRERNMKHEFIRDYKLVSHSFSENVLYKNADFSLNKGEHIGIARAEWNGKKYAD